MKVQDPDLPFRSPEEISGLAVHFTFSDVMEPFLNSGVHMISAVSLEVFRSFGGPSGRQNACLSERVSVAANALGKLYPSRIDSVNLGIRTKRIKVALFPNCIGHVEGLSAFSVILSGRDVFARAGVSAQWLYQCQLWL